MNLLSFWQNLALLSLCAGFYLLFSRRPVYAVFALILLSPIEKDLQRAISLHISSYTVHAYTAIIILAAVALAAKRIYRFHSTHRLTLSFLWPFVIYISLCLPSLINAPSIDDSLRILSVLLINILLLFVIVNSIENIEDFNKAVRFLFIVANIVGLYGIAQYVFGLAELFNFKLDIYGRPNSFLAEANNYALFAFVPFIYMLTLKTLADRSVSRREVLWTLGIQFVSIVITQTRGIYLGLLIVIGFFFLMSRRYGFRTRALMKTLFVLLILSVVSFVLFENFWTPLISRIAGTGIASGQYETGGRWEQVEMSMEYIEAHPFIGGGIGNWGEISGENYSFRMLTQEAGYRIRRHTSLIFGALVETGVLGLFGILLIVFHFSKGLTSVMQTPKSAKYFNHAVSLYFILFGVFVVLTVSNMYLSLYAWIPMALAIKIHELNEMSG